MPKLPRLPPIIGAQLLYETPLYGTRFTLGLAELIWALTLWWPGDSFSRPTYTVMASIADEHTWAWVFFITGVIQFFLLATNQIAGRLAVAFAFWNSIFWFLACYCMYKSVSPPPAAISGEAALAVAASWVFIRTKLKVDYEPVGR